VLPFAWVSLLLAACSNEPPPPAANAPEAGERLYLQNCVACHREEGTGVPGVFPSLAGSAVANGDPKELTQWVLAGVRPKSMPEGRYSTQMLQFGWMKDQDAAALLTYVRSHFGNSSPPVDADSIAKARP
jgi:mono/diheme cytochrome c family protein